MAQSCPLPNMKPCPTCEKPMGLVRILQLDCPYEIGLFKCERCKWELCMHMESGKPQGDPVKSQDAPSPTVPLTPEELPRDEAPKLTYRWGRATPHAVDTLEV